jgi:asparagine synthetase B (glutamine-hydrolysing)
MRETAHQHLLDTTEDWKYTIKSARSDYSEAYLSLWDDNGSNNLSHICSLAKRDNRKIFISGAGSDELYSDYGYAGISKYQHSNFGGRYPDVLTEDFLKNTWLSFFGSSMDSYLAKDEWVAGSYSLEGRYPFIDVKLVQEFLSLSVDLKNSKYKSVLHEYLTRNNFPFEPGQKIGF